MNKTILSLIVSILQGASWALAVLLSTYLFMSFYHNGLVISIFAALFGLLTGLSAVAFFELINVQIKKIELIEENNKLLQEILKQLQVKE